LLMINEKKKKKNPLTPFEKWGTKKKA